MKTILIRIHAIYRARRPFLEGMGSVVNISGRPNAYKRFTKGDVISDMRDDWEAVGLSISDAMNDYQRM